MSPTDIIRAGVGKFLAAYLKLLRNAPDSKNADVESERQIFTGLLEHAIDTPFFDATPVSKPVCRFLDQAHSSHGNAFISDLTLASRPLCDLAVWRNKYRNRPGREALFNNFAFCDFIGTDGWFHTKDVSLGLTLLGPDTDYPFHGHPARELYFLLSGPSDWAVDYRAWQRRVPGDWLLHTEMQPHAMRSHDIPMLAISAWRGDIETRSQFQQPATNSTLKEDACQTGSQ